ncbi:M48 family metallopeptidase [Simiduia sp. 21SJ11W-1]|uniref:M48 family metallopeptidase n=1 Tax=Simiduia sp. 21SJ11W-1 TaxID=2909669 RepID=UPI0020A1669E|nr:SprT family zinc-dependent metalloprotease [Simiduia sp. 21SJ11W-1]UTA48190.1 M48 family metallopeptidase [Simiduia sp. 21SJ11W-1]
MNAQALPQALLDQLRVCRSPRRTTVGIRVLADGVQVSVPKALPDAHWLPLVAAKQAWIIARQADIRARQAEAPSYGFTSGECLPYLGRHYPLQICEGARTHVQLVDNQWQVALSRRGRKPQALRVQAAMAEWYQAQAGMLLTQKSRQLAARIGRSIGRVTVKRTRSKWGHCTSLGDLQYNWLIVQAPEAVVDYLVAHEVSHLRHPNHSAAFWAQVGALCPDYLAQRRWLKRHGHSLCL